MKEIKVIGNIGKIDMKYTPQGKALTEFSVAVNTKGKNGEKETEWFKCTAWEKVAEIIHQYAKAGSKIYVSGLPKVEAWTSKEGEARAQIVVTVREFEFLSKIEHSEQPADEEYPA